MLIKRTSLATGKVHEIDLPVTEEQLKRWKAGEFIQDVMPHLSKEHREFLISGTTPEEWTNLFSEEQW